MIRTETAIVGSGPYGLSLAAHLRARGADHIVVGQPMNSWRAHMPKGLYLKSEPFATNLSDPDRAFTLKRFRDDKGRPFNRIGDPVALDEFLEYSDWFQAKASPDTRRTLARDIRRDGARGFLLDLDDGETVRAQSVALATGHLPFACIPDELAHLPSDLCRFVADPAASDVSNYRGKDVAIIGLGQSALQHAALLREAGARPIIIGRGDNVVWNGPPRTTSTAFERLMAPDAPLGPGWRAFCFSEFPAAFRLLPARRRLRIVRTNWAPAGAWWLRDRVESQVAVYLRHVIESAAEIGGRVHLRCRSPDGSQQVTADHVIAATGYKVDFARLTMLERQLRQSVACYEASPVLSSRFETSVPGLYAVGLVSAATFGPAMRFMDGARCASHVVSRALSSGAMCRAGAAQAARLIAATERG